MLPSLYISFARERCFGIIIALNFACFVAIGGENKLKRFLKKKIYIKIITLVLLSYTPKLDEKQFFTLTSKFRLLCDIFWDSFIT